MQQSAKAPVTDNNLNMVTDERATGTCSSCKYKKYDSVLNTLDKMISEIIRDAEANFDGWLTESAQYERDLERQMNPQFNRTLEQCVSEHVSWITELLPIDISLQGVSVAEATDEFKKCLFHRIYEELLSAVLKHGNAH